MTADAPLDPQDLARLRELAAGRSKAALGDLIAGVGSKAMVAALAGLPVRAATRELIRQHLVRPVCPRCEGVTPGRPHGDPANPHPGPFGELCDPCSNAVEQALRDETNYAGADTERARRIYGTRSL